MYTKQSIFFNFDYFIISQIILLKIYFKKLIINT